MTGSGSQLSPDARSTDMPLPQKKAVAKRRSFGAAGALTVVQVQRRRGSSAADDDDIDDENDNDDPSDSDSTSDIDTAACSSEVCFTLTLHHLILLAHSVSDF